MTVAGVALVTVAVDNVKEMEGVPGAGEAVDVTEKPTEAVASAPATVLCAIARSAPLALELAGVILVVTTPLASLSPLVTENAPRLPPAVLNLTTWPGLGAPAASRTVAVSVAGVAVVTLVVERATVTVGCPVLPLLGDTWKPIEPVTEAEPTVAFATTRSAPFAVDEAGVSLTTAWPDASVSAELALNAPSAPGVLKLTTCPARGAPAEEVKVAVTVAGAANVAVVDEIETTSDPAVPVVVVPEPVPDPLPVPKVEVPALPPPPPHAANRVINADTANHLIIFNRKLHRFRCSPSQRAAVRSVTTLGVRKIKSSVFVDVTVLVLNRLPR